MRDQSGSPSALRCLWIVTSRIAFDARWQKSAASRKKLNSMVGLVIVASR